MQKRWRDNLATFPCPTHIYREVSFVDFILFENPEGQRNMFPQTVLLEMHGLTKRQQELSDSMWVGQILQVQPLHEESCFQEILKQILQTAM